MSNVILLGISILLATASNLLLRRFRNNGLRGTGDVLWFNALISVVWLAELAVMNGFKPISMGAILWGVLYGVGLTVFQLSKMQSISSGPVSLTTFIGCSALLIQTVFGVVYLRESISLIQILAMGLLLFSLYLVVSPKGGHFSEAWFLWCALYLFVGAAIGIVFRLHQASPYREEITGMMLSAAVTSIVLFSASALIIQRKADGTLPCVPKKAIPYFILIGLVSCSYNRIGIFLNGVIPGVIYFPVFNGSVIMLVTLGGIFLFGERLKWHQTLGMVLGLASLIILNLKI